ncbi:hypothetical protein L596_004493 [Steinernema carpocapsae]|uniref:tRNA-5-taurinomethyluridine 2-sulfurtransferase n=1 Tax=Steinernema carpocapsae TaxID=34508 RepID=A0A4U8UX25_STECR|nr:hypothetical protein L596_004493 [Steinernema carpocapsae]
MSGGVDSAVSAFLLKERGFDVVGVYMVNWDHVDEGSTHCPRTKDQADAQTVCDQLGIKLHVVNFVKEYWTNVFTPFLTNYRLGRTVVSDIACNTVIKFDLLHQYAFGELHVDAVATGHFARTSQGDFLEKSSGGKPVHLITPVDPLKDQTYFLSGLKSEQLQRSMFPVGSLLKTQVRTIAENERCLSTVAKKAESMGICFVGKRKNFESFLDQYIEPKPGVIMDKRSGIIVSDHKGLHHFTLGKRVRVKPEVCQSPDGLFVCELDPESNTVYVCRGSANPLLYACSFIIEGINWISGTVSKRTLSFRLQRTHPVLPCEVIHLSEGKSRVIPLYPIRAAAPGQTCVFYENDICLGGGQIVEVSETL